ncbi:MAG: ImmA/IrrE family metallo-endopeptidase [Deltaproteobacteria bacterium]|nr:ImmA/IrrE family metallo-endopeptidase [Deltaproteobacteria bacterium]
MKVPWVSKKKMAHKAGQLLDAFEASAGYRVKPPIPVEEIIERTLGLKLIYTDLTEILGAGDVLGATYVESRTVCINERLFERGGEGRLVFTCAHEVGHWVLHRRYVTAQGKGDRSNKKAIVCRAADAKAPIEWQADYFAACLLMPEREIREAFEKVCGPKPLVIGSVGSAAGSSAPCEAPCLEQWPLISAAMCETAGFSNISKQAMIIRLQELGLLINNTSAGLNWQTLLALEA